MMQKLTLLVVLLAVAGCRESSDRAAPPAKPEHAEHAAAPPTEHAATPPAAPAAAAAPPANEVQAEMRLLVTALETAVRGIGLGDVRAVEHELHRVHAAKEATGAALQRGTYRLPKNPEQVDHFRALDEAFHVGLGRLVEASMANDVPATAEALGEVLRGCDGCHREYRP